MTKKIRERLLSTLEALPESRLEELLDFVEFLLTREHRKNKPTREVDFDPAQDPILEYIGGVAHGSLAQDIDRELYGEEA
jgi:hypothetical protein